MTKTRWLLAAAIFHLLVTLGVFVLGHFRLLPSVFDEFGNGTAFAADGLPYRNLGNEIAFRWQTEGISVWLDTPAPLHLRLYTLSFRVLGPVLGYNILAAEPFNLLFYCCILALVYFLGKELFDERVALPAAIVVGVWPSFLIHSTQLLRDPLSIACFLAVVFILAILLKRTLTIKQCAITAILGTVTLCLLWIARGNMWNIVVIAELLAAVFLVVRMVHQRKFSRGIVVVGILVVASVVIPDHVESMTLAQSKAPKSPLAISRATTDPGNLWQRVVLQAANRRAGFRVYGPQGSNIDDDVRLDSNSALAKFIPRATMIGVFAPFPQMWVERGVGGRGGRLISGAETLLMYVCYALCLVGLWHARRSPAVWLAFLTALLGMVALGVVVVNVGALFRLRYVFWILLIPLGIKGAIVLYHLARGEARADATSQSS